eukprot:IDg7227t1
MDSIFHFGNNNIDHSSAEEHYRRRFDCCLCRLSCSFTGALEVAKLFCKISE